MAITPILEFKDISKSFSGIEVLKNVSISVNEGEVHALMGENGAGKSTLMKILMGLLKPGLGKVLFQNEDISNLNVHERLRKGISMIHQEILMVADLSIAQNVFLGKESTTFSWLKENEINLKTAELFNKLSIKLHPKTKMTELSIAQMQMVEIVKAISNEAKIIIMDEPTSALSENEVSTLFKIIKDLKSKGVAIIYISHKMNEIYEIADRITVLRDGELIETNNAHELENNRLISLMVGREIDNLFPESNSTFGNTILKVEDLCSKGKFENINFEIKAGEVLGLSGLIGAGRTEIARVLAGIDGFESGSIIIDNEVLTLNNPNDAIQKKIAYVSEDRKTFGFIPDLSVTQNLTLATLKIFANGFLINNRLEQSAAESIKNDLKIKTHSLQQKVKNLSGGNQQKVVIGKALLIKPKLIILDEPTRGIDIGAKFEIYKLIRNLSNRGIAILLISSELPEILGLSDRILVLSQRKQKAILYKNEASQEKIMRYAIH